MPTFDSSTLLMMGQRSCQEDAVISSYPIGADFGFTVLSDGMGGSVGGDLASKICVSEIQKSLLENTGNLAEFKNQTGSFLKRAVEQANIAIGEHVKLKPEYLGMGATVVGVVNFGDKLFWASVGDSLLLLYREGKIFRLNADHSMAAEIDEMAKCGKLSQSEAETHPDRCLLTSALTGQRIGKIDCPGESVMLLPGDFLIVASDGIMFLSQEEIVETVRRFAKSPSQIVAQQFKSAIELVGDDEQDNVSMSIVKVLP